MSLNRKFTLWIISILLLLGILSAYLYYNFEMKEEVERLESLGNVVGQILEQALDNYMLTKEYTALGNTLKAFMKIEPISRIWLINKKGVIIAATDMDKKIIGTKLSPNDPRCQRCHREGQRGLVLKEAKTFRWVELIENKSECHKCHNPAIKHNGVYIIDFSLIESQRHLKKDILRGLMIFLLSLLVIGTSMILLTNSVVIRRLKVMIDKIKRFKEGDYSVTVPVEGNDEITRLEEGLNKMIGTINVRDREKDELFKEVSRSQKEWQETFDCITDPISIHDRDFNIIKFNKAFAEYFGLHPSEVINKKCYEVFHWTDTPIINCPHKQTMENARPVTEEILDPKNQKIFQVSTFPYYSPDGDFIGSIHIARDITEEKEKERRLIMSERLATLGQMASSIAHEINNPLASIAGCAEGLLGRLRKGRFEPELFENYLKIIEEEISRCKGITSNMLSFVRKTAYEKKGIDINSLLDKTLEIIGFQERLRWIDVIKDYKEGMPAVWGNECELRQVFTIIITNALDAMEDKGTLTITSDLEDDRVSIKISDTGPGISPEHINRIFDPFFTTKSEKGGTGLGLSIARKIIMDHNGTIDVFSEKGKGTTFKIMLPL